MRELAERRGRSPLTAPASRVGGRSIAAARELGERHDDATGGFGGAPKFPPSMVLEFLLRARGADRIGAQPCDASRSTCERMARGGIYDQLGGGFARYSVDARLARPALREDALRQRLARPGVRALVAADRSCRWPADRDRDLRLDARRLLTAEGGFASSLDADSEGEEGRYLRLVPAEVGRRPPRSFGVTEAGRSRRGVGAAAARGSGRRGGSTRKSGPGCSHSGQPGCRRRRDDKVVAAWNGLAVAALAEVGGLFDRPELLDAAPRCATLLVDLHLVDGRLRRVSRDGVVGEPAGVLEDYGDVAEGCSRCTR